MNTDEYRKAGYGGPIPPVNVVSIGKDCCRPSDAEVDAEAEAAVKRIFESGATRDLDNEKLDYEGFLSPQVLQEFAEYMHKHRFMKDGTVRASDNWQKGMPQSVYLKSLWRHFHDLWLMHRLGVDEITRPDGEHVTKRDALAGIQFNLQGYWLEEITKDSA